MVLVLVFFFFWLHIVWNTNYFNIFVCCVQDLFEHCVFFHCIAFCTLHLAFCIMKKEGGNEVLCHCKCL
jgi:hypothetical protein